MELNNIKPKRKRVSDHVRLLMSEARKGIPKSEEHKAKIGEGNRGKVRTPEMRKAMSDIKLAWWAQIKDDEKRSKKVFDSGP